MKYSNNKIARFVKPVFSESTVNSQNYLNYPLGEDFYNLIIEENQINNDEILKITDLIFFNK
jgi:hypothetical protein